MFSRDKFLIKNWFHVGIVCLIVVWNFENLGELVEVLVCVDRVVGLLGYFRGTGFAVFLTATNQVYHRPYRKYCVLLTIHFLWSPWIEESFGIFDERREPWGIFRCGSPDLCVSLPEKGHQRSPRKAGDKPWRPQADVRFAPHLFFTSGG